MDLDFYPFLRFISKTAYYIDETVSARDCRIFYIISGHGSFESGAGTSKLCPNTLIFYPCGKAYRIKFEEKNEALFYTLNFDFSQDYKDVKTMKPQSVSTRRGEESLHSIPKEFSCVFSDIISFDNALWAEKIIDLIYAEAVSRNSGYNQICDSNLRILLINIYRKTLNERYENPICEKIKDLIHNNLQMNVKELAAALNYHPFYLNEVFKKSQGITLHKYLVMQRLIKANELISTTQKPLSEIAVICGFSSQSHFSAAFKNTYHITPKNMRRQI